MGVAPSLKVKALITSVTSDSLQLHGLRPTWLHSCPWNSPDKNTRVGSPSILQGIFLTQGLNLGLHYCRLMLYHQSRQGKP